MEGRFSPLNLFLYAMTFCMVSMSVALIGPAVVGSDKSPSFEPVIGLISNLVKWFKAGSEQAVTPEDNPEPFFEVVQDSAQEIGAQIKENREAAPGEATFQSPMMTVCDTLTDRPRDDKVPLSVADAIHADYEDGQRFSVPELQQRLGPPHCTYRNDRGRRWLVDAPLAAIDAFGKDEPTLTTVNF